MGAGDGALAWEYLGRNPEYRTVWAAQSVAPAFETGPFPIRIQNEADLAAGRFALLALEDPDRADGMRSPFWAEAPMLEGELVAGAKPLVAMLDAAGARIEGLRLAAGGLVLKIERGEYAAQVHIGAPGPFPVDASLVVRLEYGLPLPLLIGRLRDLWALVHTPVPREGRVRGEDIESF